jgi:hypothetical protein
MLSLFMNRLGLWVALRLSGATGIWWIQRFTILPPVMGSVTGPPQQRLMCRFSMSPESENSPL